MADAQVTWTGNATQMLAAYKQMEEAHRKEVANLSELKAATNAAAKEEIEANRQAAKIRDANLSAQEKYNAAVSKAQDLHKRGKLSQADLNRELDRQKQILDASAPKVEALSGKVLGFGKEALAAFTGVGSAIAGVMAVASLVKGEYEEMKRRAGAALDSQMTFAQATRGIGVGFKADDSMSIADVAPAVQRIMLNTGANAGEVSEAVKAALAGRGALSNAQAFQMAEMALRVDRTDAGLTRELATRGGLLSQAAGWTDPRKALSLFSDLQNAATVVAPRDVGQSGMSAVTDLLTYGESPETAAELFATLNNLMNDTEGARTKTATGALALQLRDFAPDPKKHRVPKEQVQALRAATSPSDKIAVMQSSPELRKAFLESSSFEIAATPSIEQLLSGSDAARTVAADVRAKINDPTAAAFGEFVAAIDSMPGQGRMAQLGRRDAARDVRRVEDMAGGAAGAAFREFEAAIADVDLPGFDSLARGQLRTQLAARQALGYDTATAAADTLDDAVAVGSRSFLAGGGMSKEHLDALRESVAYLRAIAGNTSGPPPEAALGK